MRIDSCADGRGDQCLPIRNSARELVIEGAKKDSIGDEANDGKTK